MMRRMKLMLMNDLRCVICNLNAVNAMPFRTVPLMGIEPICWRCHIKIRDKVLEEGGSMAFLRYMNSSDVVR